MKIYGLTGAPGCGKSAVLKIFSGFGCPVADADAFCRAVHQNPQNAFHEQIRLRWGDSVIAPDGSTDRAAVAERVFHAPEELAWLESQLYPAIGELARNFFGEFQEKNGYAVYEVPLLFERKWDTSLAGTIAVWSPEPLRRERLHLRGWDDSEIDRRSALQLTADRKLEMADYGLINDGPLEKLEKQCLELNRILS